MSHRRRMLLTDETTENFWPAFTDLTSTIALILFVLILLAYIQNLISGKKLEYAKGQLEDTVERLQASNVELGRREVTLRLLEDELERTSAEIDEGSERLKLSEQKIDEQKKIIAESNRELGNLRSKLNGIAVLRVDVLEKVKRSLEGELKAGEKRDPLSVRIADNGNIVIDESLVFEYNSSVIKDEGKKLLDIMAKAFANLLADTGVRENIDVVTIQGHTDERGSTTYNRDLSSKRAIAVLNYMFDVNRDLENRYGSYFAASAFSEFRPVARGKTEGDFEKNRRIEISVVLKDSNLQNVIENYLKNINPIFSSEDGVDVMP